jgi:ribose transport system ATP-binding protein
MFAKWLRREPAVFLLDEPTQGVDVGAKAVLHAQLVQAAAAGAAIVISSSDVDELAAICQRVIVCRDGRPAADLLGGEVSARAISRECLLGSAPATSRASPGAFPATASPTGGSLDQERSPGT